jgi:hypothetical protein
MKAIIAAHVRANDLTCLRTYSLFVLLLLGGASVGVAQANFTQISNVAPVTAVFDGSGTGWADYDNDGYLDLFVANFTGHNYLFHNEHNGTFVAVTNGAIVKEPASESYGVAWGDYNNDGFPDLFVGNGYSSGGSNFLYSNNGDGSFTKVTNGPIATASGYFSGCAWGDFDRDGFIDLFVANDPGSGGTSLLFHNNGDGTFAVTNSAMSITSHALVGSWADFNNDGWPDLFVANGYSTGPTPNFLYRNFGNGSFTRWAGTNFVSASGASVCAAWGDYDNDGFLDVFIGNNGQKNELYHNNGNGSFAQVTVGSIVNDISSSIAAAWGDYDNDGWLDLFVGNRDPVTGQPVKGFLYHNNADGTFTKVVTGPIAEFTSSCGGCAWGDYDNDGALDLFVSSESNLNGGRNALFHNTGTPNHWIKVRCWGGASNRMGIGAKVRVSANLNGSAVRQLREVTSGDGFGNGALIVHFGLGGATNAELVRIEWPSGQVQELHNLPSDQSLDVFEPPTLHALNLAADGFHLEIRTSGAPLTQYRVEWSPNLRDWNLLSTIAGKPAGTLVPVMDSTPALQQPRFYRLVWLNKGYTP